VRFYQSAAVTANVDAVDAAEAEEALVQDIDGAVHGSSCVAGSLGESFRSGSPLVDAAVDTRTAGSGCLFRANAATYLRQTRE
jgi:hypothetical protein